MAENASFGLYDPEAETEKSARNLPHWFQPGVAVFITFRTADSMPREVIKQWQDELRQWLCRKGLPLDPTQPLPDLEAIPEKFRAEYKKQRSRLWHWHLDRCHGECLLRRREFAEIVLQALLHFDGQRYDLASAIIMPNHSSFDRSVPPSNDLSKTVQRLAALHRPADQSATRPPWCLLAKRAARFT